MELYWIDAASIAPVVFKSPTSENDKMPLARYTQSVIRGLWTRHIYQRVWSNGKFLMFETSKKTIEQVAPKVIKRVTPWWIRWFYSIFGDRIKMATTSIAPDGINASDSVVCVLFSVFYCMIHSWYLINVSITVKINGRKSICNQKNDSTRNAWYCIAYGKCITAQIYSPSGPSTRILYPNVDTDKCVHNNAGDLNWAFCFLFQVWDHWVFVFKYLKLQKEIHHTISWKY